MGGVTSSPFYWLRGKAGKRHCSLAPNSQHYTALEKFSSADQSFKKKGKMDLMKDKGSRSGSKTNLNDSTMPLLEDIEAHDKEKMELKEKNNEEKDDSNTEKHHQDDKLEDQEQVRDTPLTDSQEPQKKKKKSCHKRGPSCVHTLSMGVNVLDRDEKSVNQHVNLAFEDILAEPDNNQTFDPIWRLTFIVFTGTKLWLYRILAAIIALPCAVCWGVNFALLSLCNVWAVSPCLRILEINFRILKRVWSALVRTFFDPIFESVGMLWSNVKVHTSTSETA